MVPSPLATIRCRKDALGRKSALSFSVENLSLTRLDHIETRDDQGVWRIVCVNRVYG